MSVRSIRVGDLVRWRFWRDDIFEGPQPIGLVVKVHGSYNPAVVEVLYNSGYTQWESVDALEIVSLKPIIDTN